MAIHEFGMSSVFPGTAWNRRVGVKVVAAAESTEGIKRRAKCRFVISQVVREQP